MNIIDAVTFTTREPELWVWVYAAWNTSFCNASFVAPFDDDKKAYDVSRRHDSYCALSPDMCLNMCAFLFDAYAHVYE